MSKGMRWWIEDNDANRYVPPDYVKPRYIEVMPVAEHERVVAELKASIEHSETKVGWLLHDNEKNVRERDAVIAKQAKVIERIKTIAENMDCTCGSEGHSDTSYRDGGCFQREILESIERGET